MGEKILLSSPHMSEEGYEEKFVKEAFDTNWIAPAGKNIIEFEKEISNYVGTKAAVAVSSGTAAIHLALKLLDIKQNDYVFCSSFTFVASANPILYEKAIPVFIDSEPETWNMSPKALQKAFDYFQNINQLPKAVILVHLYGQTAKVDEILEICYEYNVPVIEDSAESLGSIYKGKKSGTHGKMGIYSFNGNKIITTSGGGMLVSDDISLINKARFLATQSREKEIHYEHNELGYNYRMSNISAGIGRGQLRVIEDRVNRRREIFKLYQSGLANIKGIEFLSELNGTFSNRWLTTILIDEEITKINQQEIIYNLNKLNIETRPLWKPMHLQPLFKEYKFFEHEKNNDYSKFLFKCGICLPSGSNLTNSEIEKVIKSIVSIIENAKKTQVNVL